MLWRKAWLETRWRFAIGLVLLTGSAAALVAAYPAVTRRLPLASGLDFEALGGSLGEQIRQGVELFGEYRGYVWWQGFRQSLRETWTIVAVLLGAGGLLAQASGGAALFTLSLPVSRRRLLEVRAATALAELLVLAIVPALVVPAMAPAIGQTYSVLDALVHGACLFVAGTVFFSLTFFLSTVFSDIWRPALIALAAAYLLFFAETAAGGLAGTGFFGVMSAESYFRRGELPWPGLILSAAASAALLAAATANIARRDF